MTYFDELKRSMDFLAEHERTVFVGQNIVYGGNLMCDSLKDVPREKKIELPLIEDAQLGMCIGLALRGFIPVCIYPRMEFLAIAMNQLVNHLDKMRELTHGEFSVGVIIRTAVGSTSPMDPGCQHKSDYSVPLSNLMQSIQVLRIGNSEHVMQAYTSSFRRAVEKNPKLPSSTILVEFADKYNEE